MKSTLPRATVRIWCCLLVLPFLVLVSASEGVGEETTIPIGELTDIEGVRNNQLRGVGLVIGLNGTGDQSPSTRQVIANVLLQQKINIPQGSLSSKNIALVFVTAELPPFKARGSRVDVTVNSAGDATSLFGGTLLQTPLKGADELVYAVAQGPLSVGGFSAGGQAATASKNHPTVGRILGGGLVEETIPMKMLNDLGELVLLLRNPGFTTARRIADQVQEEYSLLCNGFDAVSVRFQVPDVSRGSSAMARLVDGIQQLRVAPMQRAKVIINERTGTIVAGNTVLISSVSIAHGDLKISISESPEVSQPAPFSEGETAVVPRTTVEVEEEPGRLILLEKGISAAEMAESLNTLGVTALDLSNIFQALKKSGALHAEIEFM